MVQENRSKERISSKWQSMHLSDSMRDNPEESQVSVFRSFVSKLKSLQNKLDDSFHDEKFLIDTLLTAYDIPFVQSSLRDGLPDNSQQRVNRITIQLNETSSSEIFSISCEVDNDENETHYYLGKSYWGDARRATKKPLMKIPGTFRKDGMRNDLRRTSNLVLMRGVKGFFVCGENHRSNTRNKKEKVTGAIQKLK